MNSKLKECPLCHQALWVTENGLAAHVWHQHPESRICMSHGKSSQRFGDPSAPTCHGGSVMALRVENRLYDAHSCDRK